MKITIEITDTPEGGVKTECFRDGQKAKMEDLLALVRGRAGAATSACMYALGMLTWAVKRSRELGRSQQIITLPPGVRGSDT